MADAPAEWARAARRALESGPAALVTVLASEGSVPRDAGTRMVVDGEAIRGTIGGGRLEFQAIAQARALLDAPPGSWRVQDYPLGPLLGQCCGGRVRLLIERLDPAHAEWLSEACEGAALVTEFAENGVRHEIVRCGGIARTTARGTRPAAGTRLVERIAPEPRPLLLFGAGHVGQAIARGASGLPFALRWFDTRAECGDIDGVALVGEDDAETLAREAPADGAVLILTHDHGLDYRLVAAALAGPARYVGVIGSGTKRARFRSRLVATGLDAERMTCPIGLPSVRGKTPEIIAVSVYAELLGLTG